MNSFINVPSFNTVLNDEARKHYLPATNLLLGLLPEMMSRKIPEANVQQAFILSAVLQLLPDLSGKRVLCAGCFEDTAYEALCRMGYPVHGIDPQTDGHDLASFVAENPELQGTYDLVFATSVLEHVPEDESFVRDASHLVRKGGHVVLTCDFDNAWKPGGALPPTDVRLFTVHDLEDRLLGAMDGCSLLDKPDWGDHETDFHYGGCCYSFATFTVIKN